MTTGVVGLVALALVALAAAAEPEWEDSPSLTTIWQASSADDTDKLMDVFVQGGHEVALSRSSDGRGPLFWAYEFKLVRRGAHGYPN